MLDFGAAGTRRVSADPTDSGFLLYEAMRGMGRRVSVLLDGEEVMNCGTADEASGLVIRAMMDAAGRPVVVGDEIATETLHGSVRIELAKMD